MIMTHDTSNNGSNSVCGTKTCLPKSANPSFTHENKTKIYSYIYIYIYMYMYAQWSSTNDIKSPMGFPLIFPSSQWFFPLTPPRSASFSCAMCAWSGITLDKRSNWSWHNALRRNALHGWGMAPKENWDVWDMSFILMKILYWIYWMMMDIWWYMMDMWWIYDTWLWNVLEISVLSASFLCKKDGFPHLDLTIPRWQALQSSSN